MALEIQFCIEKWRISHTILPESSRTKYSIYKITCTKPRLKKWVLIAFGDDLVTVKKYLQRKIKLF